MKFRISLSQILVVCSLLTIVLIVSPVSALIFTDKGSDITNSGLYEITNASAPSGVHDPVTFFYDPDCESCQAAEEFFTTYLSSHPDVVIENYSIFNETGEKEKFDSYKTKFHRDALYVPVVFIGPVALEGAGDINEYFEDVYQWYNATTST